MTKKLDLSDPLVFKMADINHVPFEGDSWSDNGKLVEAVVCEQCHQVWPCATRVELGLTGDTLAAFSWGEEQYHMIKYKKGEPPGPYVFIDGAVYPIAEDEIVGLDDDED